jgi:Tol biopolymer transport system component
MKDTISSFFIGILLISILCLNATHSQESEFIPHKFLTSTDNAFDVWSAFSPDGKTIIFSRWVDELENWRFYTVPISGGKVEPLLDSTFIGSATRANWLWEKDIIAFTHESSHNKYRLWVVNGDGTNLQQVSTNIAVYPSWYPDGKSLAYTALNTIFKYNLENKNVTVLTDKSEILTGMSRVSPDGKRIVFAGQKNVGEPYDQTKNTVGLERMMVRFGN